MPFIGKTPQVGAFQLIDSITTSATDTYAMTVSGSAYVPESARNLIVSLNGVTQAPESAYTVSGSNIVFASALTASDVIDYILVIGDAVDIGTPSDNTVGDAQLKAALDLSSKTLTFANDQISGDVINGGSISSFASTGIDDNATSTALTITDSGIAATLTTAAQPNITSVGTLTGFTSTGIDDNATSTAITIDAAENVGIGTISPSQLLHLSSTGAVKQRYTRSANSTDISLASNGMFNADNLAGAGFGWYNNSSEAMRIDSSGNVGIGTSSPVTPLHVYTSSAGATTPLLTLQNNSATAGTAVEIQLAPTPYPDTRWSGIRATSTGAGNGTELSFLTNNTSTNPAERMRITSSGNVGIGTSSPVRQLSVEKNGTALASLVNTAGGSCQLLFGDSVSDTQGRVLYDNNGDYLALYANGSERMRITSSGNVGIGITSPAQKLHINGFALLENNGEIRFKDSGGTQRTAIAMSSNDLNVGTSAGGNLKFYNGSAYTERMRIDSSGNLGIGTSDPQRKLHVVGGIRFSATGTDANRWNVYWNSSTGDLIVVSSDERLKKDFNYDIAGIETVNKLKPVRFTWKENNKRQLGFTAQESFEADEHLAWHDTESDQWGLDGWEGYAAVLTKAIQEQQAMIDELKAEVAALKGA